MTKVIQLNELGELIPSGISLMCGGFQTNRAPVGLISELVSASGDNFQLISLPNPLPAALLLKSGKLGSIWVTFNGLQLGERFIQPAALRKAIEGDQIDWKESDVYHIIQSLRAGAMGLPFIPAPDLQSSDYATDYLALTDPFSGQDIVVVPPLQPDFVLLHVQEADPAGNLFIADPLYDELLVRAGKKVIVSCETLVEEVVRPTIGSIFVDYIVHLPEGARPSGCPGYYPPDASSIQKIIEEL